MYGLAALRKFRIVPCVRGLGMGKLGWGRRGQGERRVAICQALGPSVFPSVLVRRRHNVTSSGTENPKLN